MNNRTIKFKAKRIDNGEWVEGFYHRIQNDDGSYDHFIREDTTRHIANVTQTNFEVHPETVCQFTGMLDKHGKEIWEGDRVIGDEGFSTPVSGVVKYEGMAFSFVGEGKTGEPWFLSITADIDRCRFVEVTGSVHDEKPHGNGE